MDPTSLTQYVCSERYSEVTEYDWLKMVESMMKSRLTQDDSCFLEKMEGLMEGSSNMTQSTVI